MIDGMTVISISAGLQHIDEWPAIVYAKSC